MLITHFNAQTNHLRICLKCSFRMRMTGVGFGISCFYKFSGGNNDRETEFWVVKSFSLYFHFIGHNCYLCIIYIYHQDISSMRFVETLLVLSITVNPKVWQYFIQSKNPSIYWINSYLALWLWPEHQRKPTGLKAEDGEPASLGTKGSVHNFRIQSCGSDKGWKLPG